ncbi:MAG TPA: hypothetical protein VGG02_01315 [Chthoniobacterales bacterium]
MPTRGHFDEHIPIGSSIAGCAPFIEEDLLVARKRPGLEVAGVYRLLDVGIRRLRDSDIVAKRVAIG